MSPVTRGAGKSLLGLIALLVVLSLLGGCFKRTVQDDSNMPDGRTSGMSVLTDNLSGCQYLSVSASGMTPRIAADGKTHVGCRQGAKP